MVFQSQSLTELLLLEKQDHFVGREEVIDGFHEKLNLMGKADYKVLMYYGVGGIGKTYLRKKLVSEVEDGYEETIVGVLNFETAEHQKPENALVRLRSTIGKEYGVAFPFFDIVYTIYMKKTYPQMTLKEVAAPFMEEGDFLANVYSMLEDTPAVSIFPKIFSLYQKGSKAIRESFTRKKLGNIDVISKMDSSAILKILPHVFSEDLKEHMVKFQVKIVLFIDTFEALWEDKRLKGYHYHVDEWLRSWIMNSPGIMWTIFGRETLRWSDVDVRWGQVVEHVELDPLSDEEVRLVLDNANIEEEALVAKLVDLAEGHPYSVELLINLHNGIKREREPSPLDFEWKDTSQDLFSRFMLYLTRSEIKALEILSIARFWDEKLFGCLMQDFDTGYLASDFEELLKFSFIYPNEDSSAFEMNGLMRRSLQNQQSEKKRIKGNGYIHCYYAEQLKDMAINSSISTPIFLFEEAFHHGMNTLELDAERLGTFVDWFREEDGRFFNAGKWAKTIPSLQQLIRYLEGQTSRVAKGHLGVIVYDLAFVYFRQGQYEDALPLFEQSYEIHHELYGLEDRHTAKSLYGLGTIHHNMGQYETAEPLYVQSVEIRERVLGPNHLGVAFSVNNLATLYQDMGDLEKAEPLYERALGIALALEPRDVRRISTAYLNLAYFYEAKAEYDKALLHAKEGVEIRELYDGVTHIDYAQACNHLANIHLRLGELETAVTLYERAKGIYQAELGDVHAILSKVLHNLGVWHMLNQDMPSALCHLQEALEIKLHFYGAEHHRTKKTRMVMDSLARGEEMADCRGMALDF